MPRTIGIGVIGMGWMGQVHGRSYRQIVQRFPDSPLQPKLVICADDVESRSPGAFLRSLGSIGECPGVISMPWPAKLLTWLS